MMRRFLAFILGVCLCGSILCAQEKTTYRNPILAGFYPDPSICRVGSHYYIVNSTFSYFPGIPIFHSIDLAHWEIIGHAMDRKEQLNLDGLGVSRGIFAPALRYNKGVFYITCTLVDAGGNFILTSKTPEGPWSNPVWIPEINGIDPSMFFDENGKSYILYNSIPPEDTSLYEGHRTIRMYEFDTGMMKVIGREQILINGGTDITKKPVWIEGPHIFQKDGYYYLIAAEGGTAEQHSEVVFRSKKVDGPYESYENNPILTQRHLDPKRQNPITSTGHADFVQTEAGEWWAVFLGCRPYKPYEEECYNTGRETFLAPVKWKNGWPVITSGREEVQYRYPVPLPQKKDGDIRYVESCFFRDDFLSQVLNKNWMFLRTPGEPWYSLKDTLGFLVMQLRPESCSGTKNPDFLGYRQKSSHGKASTALRFTPKSENEKSGLLIFQNENFYYFLCKSLSGTRQVVQLLKSRKDRMPGYSMELLTSEVIPEDANGQDLFLKIEAKGDTYSFAYGFHPGQWIVLKENVDAKYLSTKVAGGFVGALYALYATSLGEPSANRCGFDWFEYREQEHVSE